ncbi:class D sortase [Neobacillus sp. LXY-4]|uniref:class D sortase n=1 Tax=Neobacillus sp. LXY-4 TaxID=3379826 RepID=UPI003EDF4EF9
MRKKKFLLILAVLLIGGGLAFSTTNAFKLMKGYFLYKIEKPAQADVTQDKKPQKVNNQQKLLYPVRPKKGEEIGNLFIPKLNESLPIFHGTDEDELEKGVGHYANSVLPGEKDNSVLSGHRDTVFRRLGEVGVGDLLTVTTSAGEFTYKVHKVRIVDADDRTVIVPKPRAILTVSTCYPFDFIGNAPQRYILVGHLISKNIKE